MLVSPTESEKARTLGTSTWKPEEFGVDFMWVARKKVWGVQRKTLKDLVVSVDDGRLAKERLQMRGLDVAVLMMETGERGGGAPREMPNRVLAALGTGYGRPWTSSQIRGVVWGLMAEGVWVEWTKDEDATLERVKEMETWSLKLTHEAARGRGSVPGDVFGRRGSREYAVWLLQSLPGVGTQMAGRIFDHFDGVPLQMREGVGEKELCEVPGVGKVTAKRILEVFGGS